MWQVAPCVTQKSLCTLPVLTVLIKDSLCTAPASPLPPGWEWRRLPVKEGWDGSCSRTERAEGRALTSFFFSLLKIGFAPPSHLGKFGHNWLQSCMCGQLGDEEEIFQHCSDPLVTRYHCIPHPPPPPQHKEPLPGPSTPSSTPTLPLSMSPCLPLPPLYRDQEQNSFVHNETYFVLLPIP